MKKDIVTQFKREKSFKVMYFLLVMFAVLFIPLKAQTVYAQDLDFSLYSGDYAYLDFADMEDGQDRQELYNLIFDEYEKLWNSEEDLVTEDLDGLYLLADIDISAYDFTTDDLLEVYMSFKFDNPIFYCAPTSINVNSSRTILRLYVDEDYASASERTRLNELVLTKLDEYKMIYSNGSIQSEIIKDIHNKLVNSMEYEYDSAGNPSVEAYAHNVIGALEKGNGVCESYAMTFQLVMNYIGYDSVVVTGMANTESHAWNLVNVDGNYYYIDCTWDDTTGTSNYFLKGSYEFEIDHNNYTPQGSGETYLYELPAVSEDNYEKKIMMSYNGQEAVAYGNANLAFADMTDENGIYTLSIEDGDVILPSGQWPKVKEIIIERFSIYHYNYFTGDVVANSDITFVGGSVMTAPTYIISEKQRAKLELLAHKLTLKGDTRIGGQTIIWSEEWGTDPGAPTIEINGGTGSIFEAVDGRMIIDSDNIVVDTLIIAGAEFECSDCNVKANTLILTAGDSASTLPSLRAFGGSYGEQDSVYEFNEVSVPNENIMGHISTQRQKEGTKVKLGDITGEGQLNIFVVCCDEAYYPDIDINNSSIELYYSLNNSSTSVNGLDTSEEIRIHSVWEDAKDYRGSLLNIGNTPIEKLVQVGYSLDELDTENNELVTVFNKDITPLMGKDSEGNLYRQYDEKLKINGEILDGYVFMDECTATSIVVPDGIRVIDTNAFYKCNSIEEVVLSDTVVHIYDRAFADCNLTEIKLPAGMSTIGSYAIGYKHDEENNTYNKIDGFKIYCYGGSSQAYAENNGFECEVLNKITGFTYSGRTANSITLNWNKNANVDGYIINIFKDYEWQQIARITDNNVTSFKVDSLEPNTEYDFEIMCYSDVGYDYCGEYVNATMSTLAPVVTGFSYSARSYNSVNLKWNPVDKVDGYVIQICKNGTWTTVKTITDNSIVGYNVTGLSASVKYSFRIRAYKTSGSTKLYGSWASKSVKTLPANTSGFTFSARNSNSVTLKWTKNTSADGYMIQQYKNGTWVTIKTITDENVAQHRISGLSASKIYSFRIRAYKSDGSTKLYGNWASKSVRTRPTYVQGFRFSTRTTNSITLNWNKNASADGYEIWMYKPTGWTKVVTIIDENVINYRVKGLGSSVNYKFKIRSYKWDNGVRLYSAGYSEKLIKTLPSYTKGFSFSGRTSTYINLKWTKNTSADGYVIEQYKGGKWVTIKTVTNKTIVNHKVTGLKKATSYKFRIKAYKYDGATKLYGAYATTTIKTR